jgi:hypothetical protein
MRNATVAAAALAIAAVFLVITEAGADVIVLMNGSKIDGKIIKHTATEVTVEVTYGRLTFRPDEIKEVVKKDGTVEPFKPQGEPERPQVPQNPSGGGTETHEPPVKPTVGNATPPSLDQIIKDLRGISQTPCVTLNAVGKPMRLIVAEIASQTKHEIKCELAGDKADTPLTLSLRDVPMWEAVLAVCRECETGFKVRYQDGNSIDIGAGSPVVREYRVFGPFALVWFGACKIDAIDPVKGQPESVSQTWMVLDMYLDTGAETKIEDWADDLVFKFSVDGGEAVEVKPVDAFQDGMGGRSWRFSPDSALLGKTATLDVIVPVSAATRLNQAMIPWKSGGETRSGRLGITLGEIKPADKRLCTSLKMAYDKSFMETLRTEGQLKDSVIGMKELALIGVDGFRLAPEMRSGGPTGTGEYGYELTFLPPDGFQPAQLQVTWNDGYRFFRLPFRIEGIPLVK